ncbi:hypothetical protein GP5015_2004 [gamma proteobacterium HTCC5015]|nr:hypothetical protein GP5015_2004 [gamma proteobacterium HTCC5015]
MRLLVKTLGVWLLSLSMLGAAQAAGNVTVGASKPFYSKFAANTPIDINLQVQGVTLGSIYFSQGDRSALAIVQNKTPAVVTPKVGVSLYDAKGNLLAVGEYKKQGVFSNDSVKAGEQANINLDFSGFVNDYSKVATFKLVFSVTQKAKPSSSGGSSGGRNTGW